MALNIPNVPYENFVDQYQSTKKNWNALNKQELENKYYAPNIESEINNRNALTEGQNIHNKYLPEEYRVANALNQQKYEWNPRNWQSENAFRNAETNKSNQMLPLQVQEQTIKNKYLPQSEQARINYQNMGGSRGSVEQKDLAALNNQLKFDFPKEKNESDDSYDRRIANLTDAYGRGDTTDLSGVPLKPLSFNAQQMQNNIMNRNIPVAARNQLISIDTLVNDMKDFDIDAVSEFAGPQGKARLMAAKTKMALDPDDPSIDPVARRYLSAMSQSIINMDQMRKAFGTSVVPDYVYKTVGRLTNPNDSIWQDKTQVKKSYNDVVKTMTKNRDLLRSKYRGGINASASENPSSPNANTKKPEVWGRNATGQIVRIS